MLWAVEVVNRQTGQIGVCVTEAEDAESARASLIESGHVIGREVPVVGMPAGWAPPTTPRVAPAPARDANRPWIWRIGAGIWLGAVLIALSWLAMIGVVLAVTAVLGVTVTSCQGSQGGVPRVPGLRGR